MIKSILLIIGIICFSMTFIHGQSLNETDSAENTTETVSVKPFVYYGRYHPRRTRRQSSNQNTEVDLDTAATVLSILPLDRLGAIIGQIMATGLKEMFNPNVGNKIVNVIENQGPSLLTSLFTNLYSTLRVPARSSANRTTVSVNRNANQQLSNVSTLSSFKYIHRSENQKKYT